MYRICDDQGTYDDRFMQMCARRPGPGENVTYVFEKLYMLKFLNLDLSSPVAKKYVVDDLADSLHTAILAGQPPHMRLHVSIRLAAILQHRATREAPESHLQTSVQTLVEYRGPRPESSPILWEEEEGSKIIPMVIEYGAQHPKPPHQGHNQYMVSFVQMQSSIEDEPSSTREGSERLSPTEGRSSPSLSLCLLEGEQEPIETNELKIPYSWLDREISP